MEKFKKYAKLESILSITGFISIILTLIVLINYPTASGYEFSIYDAYPLYFWFLIIFSFFIGISILIINSVRNYENKYYENKFRFFGFLIVLLVNFILLTIPIARGYFIFGRGDVLIHIGYIKDIMNSGVVGTNMYPMEHILVSLLSFLTVMDHLSIFLAIIAVMFFIFYIVSSYMLLGLFIKDNSKIFALAFLSIPVFGTYHTFFAPYAQFIFLIPFFLYVYFRSRQKNNQSKFTVLAVIMAIFLTFFHPIGIIVTILALLIIELSKNLNFKVFKSSKVLISRRPYNLVAIMLIIFFMWQSYTYFLVKSISKIYGSLTGEVITSQLQDYQGLISYGKPNLYDLLSFIFYKYGNWIILTVLALICILYLLYLLKNKQKLNFYYIYFSTGFIFFLIATVFTFSSANVFGFIRMYAVAIMFATFLGYFLIYRLLNENVSLNFKKYIKFCLCLILIFTVYISVFNVYYSPITKAPNDQVTASEFDGMKTFFSIRDSTVSALELGLFQYNFYDAIYGSNAQKKSVVWRENLVDHFGYDKFNSISDSYNRSYYLILNEVGKESSFVINPQYKDKWKFNQDDFNKLNLDNKVQLIYEYGNLEIYGIA